MRINFSTASQWVNRRDDAAARGGCRHKAIHWSIDRQGPPSRKSIALLSTEIEDGVISDGSVYATGFGGNCQ